MLEQELAWLKEHLPQLDSQVVFVTATCSAKTSSTTAAKVPRPGPGRQNAARPHQQQGVAPQAECWASKETRLL